MSKSLWLSGLALVVLGLPVRAEENRETPPSDSGKVEMEPLGPDTLPAPGQSKRVREIWINAQSDTRGPATIFVDGRTIQLGEYWLGVNVRDTSGGKPENEGLVTQSIVPDSPAAKAGLKEGDALLKAGPKPLKTVEDLVEAVNQAKDQPLVLEVLRDGKPQTLTVTPAKRPAEDRASMTYGTLQGNADLGTISKWLGDLQLQNSGKDGAPLRFHVFRPGAILPPAGLLQHPLPDDMTVTITKTGKQKAQIAVKQGETTWEVSEGQLDKLPENIRTHVERLLGRMPFNVRIQESAEAPAGALLQEPPPRGPAASAEGRLEKRLDEMSQRIEKLNQMLGELRQQTQEKEKQPPKSEKTPEEKSPGSGEPKSL